MPPNDHNKKLALLSVSVLAKIASEGAYCLAMAVVSRQH